MVKAPSPIAWRRRCRALLGQTLDAAITQDGTPLLDSIVTVWADAGCQRE
jgi:hypothetical protein